MLFSTDVREDIAKWAKANNIDTNDIVAYESGNPPPLRKPGFTYKPISIPVDVPGMKFYQKIPTAPQGGLPNFSKLDPAPSAPKPAHKEASKTGASSATQPSVEAKPPKETRPSVTFGRSHKDEPKPTPKPKVTFGRKGGKK